MRSQSIAALFLPIVMAAPATAAKLVLGGADFHATTNDNHYFLIPTGSIEAQGGPGGGCLIASVDLPDGAILQKMTVRYLDADASYNFSLDLKRKRRGNGVPASTVTYLDTTGWSAGILEEEGSPVTVPKVDDAYVYYLTTAYNCLDSAAQRIYTVTFDYLDPIFADDFESGNTNAWGVPPSSLHDEWLTGADFRTAHTAWDWSFDSELGTFTQTGDIAFCAIGPVELPHGATVNGFLANVYDNRSDRGLTLEVRRAPMASSVVSTVMASGSSSGNGGWQIVSDLSVGSAVVDNSSFWYYLAACVTGGTTIGTDEILTQAVQIIYTLP